MKKFLLGLLIACFTINSYGQFKVGTSLGFGAQNFRFNYADAEPEPNKSRFSWNLGVSFSYQLNDLLQMHSGLFYYVRGHAIDMEKKYNVDDIDGYERYTLNSIIIPLNIGVNYNGFQAFVGPFLGINARGIWEIDYEYFGFSYADTDNLHIGNDINTDYARPLDFGANVGVGYAVGKFQIQFNYQYGLANIRPDDPNNVLPREDYKTSTSGFSVTTTYIVHGAD